MEIGDAVKMLSLLQVGEIRLSDDETWARCSCPLAPFTHFKGSDSNPSFGVFANPIGESGYNCFTCGSGRLWDLIHRLQFTVGLTKEARYHFGAKEIFDEEQVVTEQELKYGGYYEDKHSRLFIRSKKVSVPHDVLDTYPLLEDTPFPDEKEDILNYFESRGISKEVVYKYSIRHDPISHLIVFPIMDTDGETYRLHVKPVHEKSFWYVTSRSLDLDHVYDEWGRKDFWFGIQHFDPILPVYLVESETDLLRLRTLGVRNVLAACGTINQPKSSRLPNRTIYLGFDSDNAGSKYTLKAIDLLKGRNLYRLNWDTEKIKDAGDLKDYDQFEKIFRSKIAIGQIGVIPQKGYKDVWS